MKKIELVNIADLKNPETGKTYREENNAKEHKIPLGSLVEVDFDDTYNDRPHKGLRLFVVKHDRDCDGTPLYSLSFDKNWKEDMYGSQFNFAARCRIDSGYSEETLKVLKWSGRHWY